MVFVERNLCSYARVAPHYSLITLSRRLLSALVSRSIRRSARKTAQVVATVPLELQITTVLRTRSISSCKNVGGVQKLVSIAYHPVARRPSGPDRGHHVGRPGRNFEIRDQKVAAALNCRVCLIERTPVPGSASTSYRAIRNYILVSIASPRINL